MQETRELVLVSKLTFLPRLSHPTDSGLLKDILNTSPQHPAIFLIKNVLGDKRQRQHKCKLGDCKKVTQEGGTRGHKDPRYITKQNVSMLTNVYYSHHRQTTGTRYMATGI